jgi:hypothetical protein
VKPPPDRPVLQALIALNRALAVLPAPAMFIGGIAVIARGVPRLTVDVDATVRGEAVLLEDLLATLRAHQIVPRISDAEEFARRRQVLLLVHEPTGTPIEVSLGWLPFELEALERASPVDFGGVTIPVAAPEDLIIYKAVAWRDRDREDIERLLLIHADDIDLDRVRDVMRQFADALEEPERIGQLDALIDRVVGSRG